MTSGNTMGHIVSKWSVPIAATSLVIATIWIVLAAGELREATRNGKDKDAEILSEVKSVKVEVKSVNDRVS
jgi:hypothetical protein